MIFWVKIQITKYGARKTAVVCKSELLGIFMSKCTQKCACYWKVAFHGGRVSRFIGWKLCILKCCGWGILCVPHKCMYDRPSAVSLPSAAGTGDLTGHLQHWNKAEGCIWDTTYVIRLSNSHNASQGKVHHRIMTRKIKEPRLRLETHSH